MQQDQNIKGFTILELLVVITIVAIISAVAYPNFSDWRQDRELRAAMEKAATMLSSVNTLSQRGNYPFVQFRVSPNGTTSTKFISKGMRSPAWIFDARSILDPEKVKECELNFWRIGDGFNAKK